MMGLTPREARRRLDAVLDFAELGEFVDLKLKNYSSGMLVRLGFSLMIQVDADVLLIDEVLAVGDAAFQQKCFDVFSEMRDAGRTIVLVTHDMSAVEQLLRPRDAARRGRIVEEGDPGDVARRYLRINFEHRRRATSRGREPTGRRDATFARSTWSTDAGGERVDERRAGRRDRDRGRVGGAPRARRPRVRLPRLRNANGVDFAQSGRAGATGRDARGAEQSASAARVENPLAPGRYFVHVLGHRSNERRRSVRHVPQAPPTSSSSERTSSAGIVELDCEHRGRAGRGGADPMSGRGRRGAASCRRSPGRRRSAAAVAGSSICSG